MSKVLFKIDDFLFDGWGTNKPVYENWQKFWDMVKQYPSVKINLGAVGMTLDQIPKSILDEIRLNIGTKIEIFNHSYNHSVTSHADITFAQRVIKGTFGITPTTYGAPFNNIDSKIAFIDLKLFKIDIPINAYRELENVTEKSFVQFNNFLTHYKKEHWETKVYQMHPTVWNDDDRIAFRRCLDVMVKDEKEWIFASQYA